MKYLISLVILLWASVSTAQDPATTQDVPGTTVEGVLQRVSRLPVPEGNPYPDCYFTATISIDHIVSGPSVPRKVILVVPGFFARRYTPQASYKTGDKIRATIVHFSSMPDTVRQTQQADEIEDVDLELYFPKQISPVQEFGDAGHVHFVEKEANRNEPASVQEVDLQARVARKEQMRHDLEEIKKLLAGHGGDWDKWYQSLKEFREEYKKKYEARAERWVGDSFFSAGQIPHQKGYTPEFVKSVVAFKDYLAARNVDLILVRFPYKGEVADDLFAPVPPDQISNPYLLKLYKELLEADVEILPDIVSRAKKARLSYPLMYWYQDFAEPHPAEGMVWVVAEALAERLRRYSFMKGADGGKYQVKKESAASMSRPASQFAVWSNNVFWPAGNAKYNPKEYVTFASVTKGDGTPLEPQQGLESPVLLVGSSFVRYPSRELGATLSTYLAYLTGRVPDTLSRLGSDQTIPRIMAREGAAFLAKRRVCLFPIDPWAFYDALDSPTSETLLKLKKTLLASYEGGELKKQVRREQGTPAFTFSPEGNLKIAAKSGNGFGGSFDLSLPTSASGFKHLAIEIETSLKNAIVTKVNYGNQSQRVHNFYTQTNPENTFYFESVTSKTITVSIENVEAAFPAYIKAIRIYGIAEK